MKHWKTDLAFGLAALSLIGCTSEAFESASAPGGAAADVAPAPAPDAIPTTGGGRRGTQGDAQAGILTAGAWDDNQNFDLFEKFRASIRDQAKLPSNEREHETARDAAMEPGSSREAIDVALVIDTTGSMGDEISYLQREFAALSRRIRDEFSDAEQRWSLIVYRDQGDEYVTRTFDFSTSSETFSSQLGQQRADGGGDYPEAPDRALAAMQQLSWRTGDQTARLAFWVADAPHHADRAQAMLDTLRQIRKLGVHVYPVASSGVDDLTELTMRSAAQLTGGRYLFLTDDSGVGFDHKEPRIPCYFVTHLNDAMLRMIEIEMSGEYQPPADADVVRTAGDPHDGACELQSGDIAVAF